MGGTAKRVDLGPARTMNATHARVPLSMAALAASIMAWMLS
jgi:hypothetical protein